MAYRRFERFEIRQIIQRLRMGESARQIARSQHVGRATVESIHCIALTQNWLDPLSQIPEDTTLATFFKAPRKAPQNVSSVEPFREEILKWHAQGINATTIRRALHQKHGYSGSVHALYRFLNHEVPKTPEATIKLEFTVGEMAQVDFGMGPVITERKTGEILKTWIFVCTLAWSRHQYAEIVRNQSVETWLACHRHAFEWFNGVPKKVRIDNLKAAITKACYYEPTVQRSYAELASGYTFIIDPCPVEDPRKKGRVESGVKYVKNNFVPLRDFHSVAHANEQLRAWVRSEAGNRIHGSTREHPRAPVEALCRDRTSLTAGPPSDGARVRCVGQSQASSELPRPVRLLLLLGTLRSDWPDVMARDHTPCDSHLSRSRTRRHSSPSVQAWRYFERPRPSAARCAGLSDAQSTVVSGTS